MKHKIEYVSLKDQPLPVRRIKMYKLGKFTFSQIEIQHLAIATIAIIATLAVIQERGFQGLLTLTPLKIIIYILTIGLGFLLHELAHKFAAQHYGFISEFRADFGMLGLAFIAAAFLNITFLAPGAVMILGRVSKKQNGIISVVGPLTNLALAWVGVLVLMLAQGSALLTLIGQSMIYVNCFLGLFNMIPFWVLDGKKVLAWDAKIWIATVGMLALTMFGLFAGWY